MGSAATEISQLVPELAEKLRDLPSAPSSSSGPTRLRFLQGVVRLFRRASSVRPLVLLLEDLHWADSASLLLLQLLAESVGDARILIVGTYRDEELQRVPPVSAALTELARSPTYERLDLRGLIESEVAQLIERTAEIAPSPEMISAVYRHTEGNPFFVTEVVRLLVARSGTESLRGSRTRAIPIPPGVHEVLGQRIKGLSAGCQRLLSTAAVLGGDFDLEVLEPACEPSRDDFLQALDEAASARLIHPLSSERKRFRFGHALIRETLYDELGSFQRACLHARVAEVLERRAAAVGDEDVSALAYHFVQGVPGGADADKALDYSLRAARRASLLFAYEEAADHYRRALDLFERQRPGQRRPVCELLLAVGEVLWKAAETAAAQQTFLQAAGIARELDEPVMLARAALGYGGIGYTGMWTTTGAVDRSYVELLEEALERLEPADGPLRCRLLARLGIALYWHPSPERRDRPTLAAVEMAERLQDPLVQWYALSARHIATWSPENLEDRLRQSQQLIDLALEVGSWELSAQAYLWHIAALMERGDVAAADQEMVVYSKLAEDLREPQYLWRSAMLGATRALMRGELDRMEALVFEAAARTRHMSDANRIQGFAIQLAILRREQGRAGELTQAIEGALAKFPGVVSWRAAAGNLYFEVGRKDDAQRALDAVVRNDFGDVPRDYLWLSTLVGASELCVLLRDVRNAPVLYELLTPYGERNVLVGDAVAPAGPGALFLGQLAALLGRHETALRHLHRAIEMCRSLQLPLFDARARIALADLLLQRGDPTSAAEAEKQLDRALETAQRLGSRLVLERALEVRLRAHGIDPTTETSIGFVAARVQAARPHLGGAVSAEGIVTLLFSDIEGFSRMTEDLGDEEAHRIVQSHNALVREQLRFFDGLEVEMQGDAFLLAFPSPPQAVACAVKIQRAFAAHNQRYPERPIRVRMGLHLGEAIRDAERFFGKTVIVAARIAALAAGGEILVSSLLRQPVEQELGLSVSPPRQVQLKGLADTYTVHGVEWKSAQS
jgi:class 3 adenylate cyclase